MAHELGIRSRLVLEKLGFDLRPCFADTLSSPMPPRLQQLADALAGYAEWRDVAGAVEQPQDERQGARHASVRDAPFCFG